MHNKNQKYVVPAGAESDDDEYDYDDEYYYKDKSSVVKEVQTPLEAKKTRLIEALKKNDLLEVQNELDHGQPKGFDIDETIDDHWNLLFHACFMGLPDIVEYLIEERGAFVNFDINSESPTLAACRSQAGPELVLKVVQVLAKNAAAFRAADMYGTSPLMVTCSAGHVEVVKFLLSLNDSIDAIDNEGKNSLFHAIDGKSVEVAKLLINRGINLNHTNTYGASAKEYAMSEERADIVELFPAEIEHFHVPVNFANYNRFEDLIPMDNSEVPAFFPDVVAMLRGMNCDKLIGNFAEARVSLEEFLTISDERLKEIGIEFEFQRNEIQLGLLNFHKQPWKLESLYVPIKLNEEMSAFDLTMMLANVLRQIVIIKAQFTFIKNLGETVDLTSAYDYISMKFLHKFVKSVETLKKLIKEKTLKELKVRPMLVKKKTKKISLSLTAKFSLVLVPFIAFIAFKMFKN